MCSDILTLLVLVVTFESDSRCIIVRVRASKEMRHGLRSPTVCEDITGFDV
jgi:hypothetical protein